MVFAQTGSDIVLSEIMFNPVSGNNEFIELYNAGTEAVDLNGFKIKYYTSAADVITGSSTILAPGTFAVIFEGDYVLESGIYNSLIPPSALILKISDNAFGSSGMANTTGRQISLLNNSDDTLAVYTYSANNTSSFSDEKIILNKDDSESNWTNSLVPNGTPGFRNSVSPLNYDLLVSKINIQPVNPFNGDDIEINISVKNNGSQTAQNFTLNLFNDLNKNFTGENDELLASEEYNNLSSGDSILYVYNWSAVPAGSYQIIALVEYENDENTVNNSSALIFNVHSPAAAYNDIVINEIMYAPSSGEPEWVELFNRSDATINLNRWRIGDNSTSVILPEVFLQPDSFLVISRDSSILNFYHVKSKIITVNLPALNNGGDAVVLKDSSFFIVDSLSYLPEWGGNSGGKSLERISTELLSTSADNWETSTSLNKATPGTINSITPKNYDLLISNLKSPNDFVVAGESTTINSIVKNNGLQQSDNFTVQFFYDSDKDSIPESEEMIDQKNISSLAPGDSVEIEFTTGVINSGKNIFIVVINFPADEDQSNNIGIKIITGAEINEVRNDLIINEIMYAPSAGEPEWIELFNKSSKQIFLNGYKIADNSDTTTLKSGNIFLNTGEYLVIAADSSIADSFNITSKILISSFPALNNSADKIILIDSLNRTIDSLEYKSTWGGTNGKSLERIDPLESSIDSTNWSTTKNLSGGTPGFINSVTQKEYDIETAEIITHPEFPIKGDNINISAKIKNSGKSSAEFYLQLFKDSNLDSVPDLQVETTAAIILASGDSTIIQFNYVIENLDKPEAVFVNAIWESDEDTSNNHTYKVIEAGYPASVVLINEIMFLPTGGEPEWFEIYNTSDEIINLNGWTISDVLTNPASFKITTDVFIQPESYLVITKDSSILNYHRIIPSPLAKQNFAGLNNDADGLVLKDKQGQTIDSVFYNTNISVNSGFSIERISLNAPSALLQNWGSSKDFESSTPGRINSITPKQIDAAAAEISFNPRFPVPGDDVFISAKIKNFGSSAAENISVQFIIDTDSNNVVDLLLDAQTISFFEADDSVTVTSASAISQIQNKILAAVRIVQSGDEDTLNNYIEKSIEPGIQGGKILISEVMYEPENGEPEWIEFVNVSDDSINLKDWSVSDILPSPGKSFITNYDLYIGAGEYFIICRDTSFYNYHPDLETKIIISSFGSLSSSTDGVVIYDFRNGIIDSLKYNSKWGGRNGSSLERISFTGATNDSSNWTSSLSKLKSTPGKSNSVVDTKPGVRNQLTINEIMFDPDTDNNEFVEFYNASTDSVNIGGWKLEDASGSSFKLFETGFILPPEKYFLLAADSTVLMKYNLSANENINVVNVSSFGLSASGEIIYLKDIRGNVIDSINYSDKWHNKNLTSTKNISLERVNPYLNANDAANWNSSVDPLGGTPARTNSIYTKNENSTSGISISPNPFSPDNDGFEDFTIFNYSLTQQVAQVRIKIYDSQGRLVRTLLNNSGSGSSGSVIFDGLDESGSPLRMGIYIIFLEALNDNSGSIETFKSVLVIARKL